MAATLALLGSAVSPAVAADGALTITKLTNDSASASLVPDQEFTYNIEVGCSDADCENAIMTDQLPPEFAGFEIVSTQVSPPSFPSTTAYTGCTTTVTATCELSVTFQQGPTAESGVGILAGQTYAIAVTLKVPADLSPSWASNGVPVTNTAQATADNAPTVTASADATVTIPIVVDTTVGKTWTPANQQFSPGVASTLTLTTANTSNVNASSLSLQDPSVATEGAAALDAANPFALVDFTGFGSVVAPEGADQVQVDAYVLVGGTWSWVAGAPTATAAIGLPAGVAAGDVGGLRITFSDSSGGATIVPSGTEGTVPIMVAQRATNRSTGASMVLGASVTNQASGTITVPGQESVTKTATAPYAIGALTVVVEAGKSITPARIPAGTSAAASITGKNTSNGPLSSLALADTDFFTDTLTFGGFTSPVVYPAGATGASVEWHFSGGGSQSAAVLDGSTPSAPAPPAGEHLTGFTMTFTGAIEAGTTATLDFAIAPTSDFVQGTNPTSVTNTVDVTGTNAAGSSTDPATASLEIFEPEIDIDLEKTISPAGAVQAGGTVVVQLPTVTSTDSAYVHPDEIVVEDVLRPGASDFWNAFNPIGIAPTQLSSGVGLLVEYTTDGSTWVTLDSVPAAPSASVYQTTIDPGLVPTIVGLRFTFTNAERFPLGSTVAPNIVFEARSSLRSDPATPTSVPDAPASVYEDLASATASGEVEGGTTITSPPVTDLADASIISFSGSGTLVADKQWRTPNFAQSKDTINSQSGESAGTRLGWGVLSTGYDSVTITDSATDAGAPENTVFQAFDLVRIMPVSFTADPLLRWDTVSTVELYHDGAWHVLAPPGGSWMGASGFVGHQLSAIDSQRTTGVRITVVPNDAARTGSTDPLTPPVGSGVASSASGEFRTIDLLWTLRNIVRVPTPPASDWVTAAHGYNDPLGSPNTVYNSVGVAGVHEGDPVGPVEDSDSIVLIDQPPGVDVNKTASVESIPIPDNDDVDQADYPSVTFTITSRNSSASQASYLRVTDPQPCASGSEEQCLSLPSAWDDDPFTAAYDQANPFERLNLTDIAFSYDAADISATQSTVTLWKRDAAGVLTTESLSLQAAAALTAAALVEVVGVSVLYQGESPEVNGGSISTAATQVMTLTAQVRKTLRSEPATLVTPFTIDNFVFAQSYDPVLFPSGTQSTPSDGAHDEVALLAGALDITAQKTITPATLLEKDRALPVSATLGATQGDSTVATNEVTIEDTDQEFWSNFRLTGLGAVTLPAGADQVRVDVQTDGSATWQLGVAGAVATLPAVDPATITGIRFVFNRADGAVFSHSAPPANWAAQAVLDLALLDDLRGTTTPVPFPSTVSNDIDVRSERYDEPQIYAPATATATDDIQLDPGSFRLDVAKTPHNNQHTVFPGESIPWTLEFTNDGTGYLTIEDLVDTLPEKLQFDGEPPTFSGSAGGTLSTDVTYGYDAGTRTLTFSWPEGGDRMSPGESFTITLGLILVPGLIASERATNTMVVTTTQTLSACTNTSGNAQGVMPGLGPTQCGTTNYVSPLAGASLVTSKGVRGDITGGQTPPAVNPTNPAAACIADSEGFYRSPCAANTVIGGTDEWKLESINSGTVPYTHLTVVEPLPIPGDRMLATGSSRGSTYRPVLVGTSVAITGAPAGTTTTLQVSTTANVCVGPGASLWPSDPKCSTATWVDLAGYAGDWSEVTGLRAIFDFTTTASGVLEPAGQVTIKYHTVNTVESAALPQGAPSEVPVTGNYAWNQFGAVADLTSGAPIQRAPVKAGVTLVGGPIEVTKVITGSASEFAADEFLVDVDCTIGGVTLQLGAAAVLELRSSTAYTARIDGIPIGAHCTVAEQGDVGQFGESGRTGTPAPIDVLTAAGPLDPVPAAQGATITNDYAYGSLSVTKVISTQATVGTFGPFTFTLECVSSLGIAVPLDPADQQFELAADATHTVAAGTLPIGAVCDLAETDDGGADGVAITGTGVVDGGDGTATITVGSASEATVTNAFEAGTLSVLKTVTGSGADSYGDGPFTAEVRCVYGDPEQVLYHEDALAIVPDVPTLVGVVFPVGTECSVREVDTGGANSHEDPPAVVIPGPTGGQTVGAVTADVTNHFIVGSLEIRKLRTGDGVDQFGAGPFTAQVTCTWVRNGETLTIPLPDGGEVELSEANGYAGSLDGLLVGATCVVVETDAGLATATTLDPEDGVVTILDPDTSETPATVVITNQFDIGHLILSKTVATTVAEQGSAVTYTITVTNDGQIDAVDFTVTDVLPAGAKFVSATDGGQLTGNTVTWKIDRLPTEEQVSVKTVVTYAQPGQYVNQASVQSPPGPWEPPTLDYPCPDGDASCASVVITALASTGSPVSWAWTVAILVLLMGSTFVLYATLRRRPIGS